MLVKGRLQQTGTKKLHYGKYLYYQTGILNIAQE